MNFKDLKPPIIELPANQTWHRVQRKAALQGSVRLHGFVLAPLGGLTGRFDLADESIAYLADSPETALYESLFRREVRACHLSRLQQRVLASFHTLQALRLVDLRGIEERYPVLQSLRYDVTQGFATDCRQKDLHGILYASAQHPYHTCVCLFNAGLDRARRTSTVPLVQPHTGNLHKAVMTAARGSQVPIVREN
jgi:hypothetical protein